MRYISREHSVLIKKNRELIQYITDIQNLILARNSKVEKNNSSLNQKSPIFILPDISQNNLLDSILKITKEIREYK